MCPVVQRCDPVSRFPGEWFQLHSFLRLYHATVVLAALAFLGAAGMEDSLATGLAAFRQGRFAEAYQQFHTAADAGDARGALYLGVLYDAGLGVPQDSVKAMEFYQRAAVAGSAAGAFNAAVLYDAGIGVPRNEAEAAHWYALSAARGFGRAAYNLGLLYEAGAGVDRDRTRAVALFRQAATRGVPAALAHLAALGVVVSVRAKPMPDAALVDFQKAQELIGSRSPGEVARAATLFREAAEKHDPQAEYDLGYCYERGLGVKLDQGSALKWFRQAAGDTPDAALKSLAEGESAYLERVLARGLAK